MVDHPIVLRGLGTISADGLPTLLQRTDQELIPVLLNQLRAGGELQPIASTVANDRTDDGTLKLFQPVQRMFVITLFEAVCQLPGLPRVDPSAIDSAGIAVRRLRNGRIEGWLGEEASLRGWVTLQAAELDQDPDPAQRRRLSSGNSLIDREIALRLSLAAPLSEQVTPLFVAPPDICAVLGKTVLYGVAPMASSEFSETPASTAVGLSDVYKKSVANHIPQHLRSGVLSSFPLSGRTISSAQAAPDRLKSDADLHSFIEIVRQVAIEFDAFGTSAESSAILSALNAIQMTLSNNTVLGMGDFFKRCATVFLDGASGQSVRFPDTWPTLSDTQAENLLDLIVTSLGSRLVASNQGERRFEDESARYALRGFVRVQRQPDCPPEITWSEYSEPYAIAPWYESADNGLPIPQISLPDPFDRNQLRKLKPNVAFKVPEKLFGLVNSDLTPLFEGDKPSTGSGFGLDRICSFSIPIITICAFIVLNIFLSLFDIIFRWMLFIKVCIPIPKRV